MRAHSLIWQCGIILGFHYLGVTLAHVIVFSDLQGLPLCIEPRSVQVAIFDAADAPLASEAARTQTALKQALTHTLRRYNIPFVEREDCRGHNAFVYVLYYADKQADDEPWVLFSSMIQVGEVPDQLAPSFLTTLPNGLHENYTAMTYYLDELGDDPIASLQRTTEAMIIELANAWWEDYLFERELRQRQRLRRLQLASLTLTALILSLGLIALRRRRQRRQRETDRLAS